MLIIPEGKLLLTVFTLVRSKGTSFFIDFLLSVDKSFQNKRRHFIGNDLLFILLTTPTEGYKVSWLQTVCMLNHFSCVRLFVTLWTVACQASLSIGFSRQEYWNGLPCPPPGDLPDPGIKPTSLMSPALAAGFFTTSATWGAPVINQEESIEQICDYRRQAKQLEGSPF